MKFQSQNIFFISDLHAYHKNIINYDSLPFSSALEMTNEIIYRWNTVVSKDDIVFLLGDVCFDKTKLKEFVHSLDGKIYLILGNHDKHSEMIETNRFELVTNYLEIHIKDDELSRKYQDICLFHYPIYEWNKQHRGSWMLHGHTHLSLVDTEFGKTFYKRKVMDVAAKGLGFTPISYSELKEYMLDKEISEHH